MPELTKNQKLLLVAFIMAAGVMLNLIIGFVYGEPARFNIATIILIVDVAYTLILGIVLQISKSRS